MSHPLHAAHASCVPRASSHSASTWLRASYLTGFTDLRAAEQARQQQILGRFRAADVTCLVSTSVGEEGLDLPGCCLVVQYDPATSAGKLVQARGRARVPNSVVAYFGTCGTRLQSEVERMKGEVEEC